MTRRSNTTSRISAMLVSAALIVSSLAVAIGARPMRATAEPSAPITWEQLKERIETATPSTPVNVTLGGDLVATSQIKVPAGVTVNIEGDSAVRTIWSSPAETSINTSMFLVSGEGAKLNLGNNLTLSGKTQACSTPEAGSYTFEATKNLVGGDIEAGMFYIEMYKMYKDSATGELLQRKTNDANGKVTFDPVYFTEEGEYTFYFKEWKGNVQGMTYDTAEYTFTCDVTYDQTTNTYVPTWRSGGQTNMEFNNSYSSSAGAGAKLKLKTNNDWPWLLKFTVAASGLKPAIQYSDDGTQLTLKVASDGRLSAEYVLSGRTYEEQLLMGDSMGIGANVSELTNPVYLATPNGSGGFDIATSFASGTDYLLVSGTDTLTAKVIELYSGYAYARPWPEYTAADNKDGYTFAATPDSSGGSSTDIPDEANPPEIKNGEAKPTLDPTSPQQCDDPACKVWRDEDGKGSFTSGTADEPKAFFVQVADKGELNINGATLRDFVTGGGVMHAAPVVAKGGTVNMSAGAITHNSVGYTADNSKSGENAQAIGNQKTTPGNFGCTGLLGTWTITDSAGALILTEDATANITGSASISGNRGDTGAILVQGKPDHQAATDNGWATKSTLTINGADVKIDNNVGVHHAGAIYVFNGAETYLKNGSISNNFAWNKGGAVWVSEEVYSSMVWQPKDGEQSHIRVGDAVFSMSGGKIDGNMAVQRGGAIEVMSDRVALLGGEINSNYCRVLGGAIYVEGDGKGRMYQIYIPKGSIYENHAVPDYVTDTSAPLYRTLTNNATDCGFSNDWSAGATARDISDRRGGGFNNYYGHGGGIWMCSYGGNTTLSIPGDDVYVGKNDAEKSGGYNDLPGQDILVRPKAQGKTNGVNVLKPGNQNILINEANGVQVEVGRHYDGPLALKNSNTNVPATGGITITGNVASNGGAIATDGTVILGEEKAGVYEALTSLQLKKIWSGDIEPHPITLKIYVEVGGQRYPVDGYQVTLNGTPDKYVDDPKQDLAPDEYNENWNAWESGKFTTTFGLPVAAVVEGEMVPLFTFKNPADPDNPDANLNPASMADLKKIYGYVGSGDLTADDAVIGDWQLVVEEIGADGKPVSPSQLVSLKDHKFETLEQGTAKTTQFLDTDGKVTGTYGTYPLEIGFSGLLGNDIKPEVEKYVNKDVHAEIVNFDQEFTYDILAYVPLGATEFSITDTLVDALEFADADGNATTDATASIQQIGIKSNNNHTPFGTVSDDPSATIGVGTVSAAIDGQTLTIKANKTDQADLFADPADDDPADSTKLQGKWIQVTFNARIKDKYRSLETIKNLSGDQLSWAGLEVDKFSPERPNPDPDDARSKSPNWPVDIDAKHEGIENDAQYTVKVSNGSEFELDSNVVTVKPAEQRFSADKIWYDQSGEKLDVWPTDDEGNPVKVTFELWRVNEIAGTEEKVAEVSVTDFEPAEFINPKGPEGSTWFPNLKDTSYQVRETVTGITFIRYLEGEMKGDGEELDNDKIEELDQPINDYVYTFANKIEKPEIEKYVDKDVHKDIWYSDTFTYDVIAYITKDADKFTITDTLVDDLAFDCTSDEVTLVDLGTSVDHEPGGAAVTAAGTPISPYEVTIADKTLTVECANELDPETLEPVADNPQPVTDLRGHWVKVTFTAKLDPTKAARIAAGEDPADVLAFASIIDSKAEDRATPNVGNDPVLSDEDHTGVPNKASYTIEVGNEGKYEDESNTVTVKPETPKPEIEKYVNQAVHKDVKLTEVFTYDVIAYITRDADKVVITDTLVENLAFASAADKVRVEDLGVSDNHKVTNNVSAKKVNADATVAAKGTPVAGATAAISGQTLTVTIPDATAVRGHWVRVTFDARIAPGKTVDGVKGSYVDVAAGTVYVDPVTGKRDVPNVGNQPVISDESHNGIPNTASYKIFVKNAAGIIDESKPSYKDGSNTVTVKPVEEKTPEKPDKPITPKTGDATTLLPAAIMLGASAAALIGARRLRKED